MKDINALADEITTLYKKLASASMKEIRELLKRVDQVSEETGYPLCANHPLEIFLYEYYHQEEQRDTKTLPIPAMYRELGKRYVDANDFIMASNCYEKALLYNPIDLDTIFEFCLVLRNLSRFDKMKQLADQAYAYCYTKSDLAHYYRMIGCYYLETYHPQDAVVLYEYSNLFYPTQQAESELSFLKDVLKEKFEAYDTSYLLKRLEELTIPKSAKESTLALMYQVAKLALKEENISYATSLLNCIYELTKDEAVKQILISLS